MKDAKRIRPLLSLDGTFLRCRYQGRQYKELSILDLQKLLTDTWTYPDKDEQLLRDRLQELKDWRISRNSNEDFILTFGKYKDYYTSEVPYSYLSYLALEDGKKWLTVQELTKCIILYRRRKDKLSSQLSDIYKLTPETQGYTY